MEGCPKHMMINFDLKEAGAIDDAFEKPLKQYIRDFYNENPESYNNEIKLLTNLRKNVSKIVREQADGIITMKKYFVQLQYLQTRFPMCEGGEAAVPFLWYDVYSGDPVEYKDIKYEQACLLFNLGGLFSQVATIERRDTDESMKAACIYFQNAAGAFQYIKDNYSVSNLADMTEPILSVKISIMLGQASECLLEKTIRDDKNPLLVARISLKIVTYFKDAIKLLESSSTSEMGSSLRKPWIKHLKIKVACYDAIAYLYMGNDAGAQEKYGEKAGYFKAASTKIEAARKLLKNQNSRVVETVTFISDVVETKAKNAIHENDHIYHMIIPDEASLKLVDEVALVKPLPFRVDDHTIAEHDIFAKLIPLKVHESASVYSEMKAHLLRKISEEISEKDTLLTQNLTAMKLEKMFDPKQPTLPDELKSKTEFLRQNPDILMKVEKDLQELLDTSTEVASKLDEIKEKLKEAEIILSNDEVNKEKLKVISTEYEECNGVSSGAMEKNDILSKYYADVRETIVFLSGNEKDIITSLPSRSLNDTIQSDEPVVRRMRELLNKVDQMKNQRIKLLSDFREELNKDDITGQLAVRSQDQHDDFFLEQLAKHDYKKKVISQNLVAQENILQALVEANANYALIKQQAEEVDEKFLQEANAYTLKINSFLDMKERIRSGSTFFKELNKEVNALAEKLDKLTKGKQKPVSKPSGAVPPARPSAKKPDLRNPHQNIRATLPPSSVYVMQPSHSINQSVNFTDIRNPTPPHQRVSSPQISGLRNLQMTDKPNFPVNRFPPGQVPFRAPAHEMNIPPQNIRNPTPHSMQNIRPRMMQNIRPSQFENLPMSNPPQSPSHVMQRPDFRFPNQQPPPQHFSQGQNTSRHPVSMLPNTSQHPRNIPPSTSQHPRNIPPNTPTSFPPRQMNPQLAQSRHDNPLHSQRHHLPQHQFQQDPMRNVAPNRFSAPQQPHPISESGTNSRFMQPQQPRGPFHRLPGGSQEFQQPPYMQINPSLHPRSENFAPQQRFSPPPNHSQFQPQNIQPRMRGSHPHDLRNPLPPSHNQVMLNQSQNPRPDSYSFQQQSNRQSVEPFPPPNNQMNNYRPNGDCSAIWPDRHRVMMMNNNLPSPLVPEKINSNVNDMLGLSTSPINPVLLTTSEQQMQQPIASYQSNSPANISMNHQSINYPSSNVQTSMNTNSSVIPQIPHTQSIISHSQNSQINMWPNNESMPTSHMPTNQLGSQSNCSTSNRTYGPDSQLHNSMNSSVIHQNNSPVNYMKPQSQNIPNAPVNFMKPQNLNTPNAPVNFMKPQNLNTPNAPVNFMKPQPSTPNAPSNVEFFNGNISSNSNVMPNANQVVTEKTRSMINPAENEQPTVNKVDTMSDIYSALLAIEQHSLNNQQLLRGGNLSQPAQPTAPDVFIPSSLKNMVNVPPHSVQNQLTDMKNTNVHPPTVDLTPYPGPQMPQAAGLLYSGKPLMSPSRSDPIIDKILHKDDHNKDFLEQLVLQQQQTIFKLQNQQHNEDTQKYMMLQNHIQGLQQCIETLLNEKKQAEHTPTSTASPSTNITKEDLETIIQNILASKVSMENENLTLAPTSDFSQNLQTNSMPNSTHETTQNANVSKKHVVRENSRSSIPDEDLIKPRSPDSIPLPKAITFPIQPQSNELYEPKVDTEILRNEKVGLPLNANDIILPRNMEDKLSDEANSSNTENLSQHPDKKLGVVDNVQNENTEENIASNIIKDDSKTSGDSTTTLDKDSNIIKPINIIANVTLSGSKKSPTTHASNENAIDQSTEEVNETHKDLKNDDIDNSSNKLSFSDSLDIDEISSTQSNTSAANISVNILASTPNSTPRDIIPSYEDIQEELLVHPRTLNEKITSETHGNETKNETYEKDNISVTPTSGSLQKANLPPISTNNSTSGGTCEVNSSPIASPSKTLPVVTSPSVIKRIFSARSVSSNHSSRRSTPSSSGRSTPTYGQRVQLDDMEHNSHERKISELIDHRHLARQLGRMSFYVGEPDEALWRSYINELNTAVEKLHAECINLCKPNDQDGIDGFLKIWNDLTQHEDLDLRNFTNEFGESNVSKNRYRDILPWDHTRVKLKSRENDYINASHIENLTPLSPRYIATQGPIPQCFEDFWTMVWEQRSSLIVMLTNEMESHKLKCHRYWAKVIGELVCYGNMEVTLIEEDEMVAWRARTFVLRNIKENDDRIIRHLQFTTWPDYGVPDSPFELLALCEEVHMFHEENDPSFAYPIILHCSAGVGRTGSFCCIYSAIREIQGQHGLIQIPGVVRKLRQCRPHMVQRKEQLIFCYQAIHCFAQQFVTSELEKLNRSAKSASLQNSTSSDDFLFTSANNQSFQTHMQRSRCFDIDNQSIFHSERKFFNEDKSILPKILNTKDLLPNISEKLPNISEKISEEPEKKMKISDDTPSMTSDTPVETPQMNGKANDSKETVVNKSETSENVTTMLDDIE